MSEVEAGFLDAGFTSAKKQILLMLKRAGNTSLNDVARGLHISKMAALKHLTALESRGLVERSFKVAGIGRPRVYFKLSKNSSQLFPEAYSQMTMCALAFIEQKLGREAVVNLLKQRTSELYERYHTQFNGKDLQARVRELAKLRDKDGYMAEPGPSRKKSFELLEHNCPILAIAEEYGEACAVERELFEWLLQADVDVSHRVAGGDPVCRFIVRERRR